MLWEKTLELTQGRNEKSSDEMMVEIETKFLERISFERISFERISFEMMLSQALSNDG